MTIASNLSAIHDRIARAAKRGGPKSGRHRADGGDQDLSR